MVPRDQRLELLLLQRRVRAGQQAQAVAGLAGRQHVDRRPQVQHALDPRPALLHARVVRVERVLGHVDALVALGRPGVLHRAGEKVRAREQPALLAEGCHQLPDYARRAVVLEQQRREPLAARNELASARLLREPRVHLPDDLRHFGLREATPAVHVAKSPEEANLRVGERA